ncbi:MAG TPA: hypothetical protein VES79_07840 [Solirubrobacteraceae bacterium]|nr:hypothetical protein [Solirubrobacteraceae bacterium]
MRAADVRHSVAWACDVPIDQVAITAFKGIWAADWEPRYPSPRARR